MKFTNSKGMSWTPRVTARVLADFETQTGVEVFGSMIGVAGKADQEGAMSVAQTLFGKLKNTLTLLYLACRDSSGEVTHEGKAVPYDDFCDAIEGKDLRDALTTIMSMLMESFGSKESEGSEGGKSSPFPGENSTS